MSENVTSATGLSSKVLAILKSQRGGSSQRESVLFLQQVVTSKEDMQKLAKQLEANGFIFDVKDTSDGYMFNITGINGNETGTIDNTKASRKQRIPKTDGHMERVSDDEQVWVIDKNSIPSVYPPTKKGKNIVRNNWGSIVEKLNKKINKHREKHGLSPVSCETIRFKGKSPNSYPVLDDYSFGTVEVPVYSSSRPVNYAIANEIYGSQHKPKPYTQKEVEDWMEEHNMTWHESPDRKTMMKIPSVLHGNIPHNGGVNSIKREGIDNYNSNDNVVWSNIGQTENINEVEE